MEYKDHVSYIYSISVLDLVLLRNRVVKDTCSYLLRQHRTEMEVTDLSHSSHSIHHTNNDLHAKHTCKTWLNFSGVSMSPSCVAQLLPKDSKTTNIWQEKLQVALYVSFTHCWFMKIYFLWCTKKAFQIRQFQKVHFMLECCFIVLSSLSHTSFQNTCSLLHSFIHPHVVALFQTLISCLHWQHCTAS